MCVFSLLVWEAFADAGELADLYIKASRNPSCGVRGAGTIELETHVVLRSTPRFAFLSRYRKPCAMHNACPQPSKRPHALQRLL